MVLDTTPAPAKPDLETLSLDFGFHSIRESGVCLLEAVAWFAGEPHSDAPACVCPVLAEFGRVWNDSLRNSEERDRLLKPFIPLLVGTRSTPEVELKRAFLALDWLVRVNLPAWLDLTQGLQPHAATLRGLPEICDAASLEHFRSSTSALIDRANFSMYIPDHTLAAGDAAAPARMAATQALQLSTPVSDYPFLGAPLRIRGAALFAALSRGELTNQPTTTLQASAVDLLQRMIAVKAA